MKDTSPPPDTIREIAYSFQASRTLLTAFELGIFSALGNHESSSGEIARTLGTDRRATDRLMNALVGMGLLGKQGDRFRNSPSSARYLVPTSPDFMSGLMHTVHLWDTWSTLTDAVRRGTSVPERERHYRDETDWTEAFIAAMHYRARAQASQTAARMDLSGVSRILDVGGGSGAFTVAFLTAKPGATATVFDLPEVLPLTERYSSVEGLLDRIKLVAGDYTTDELPTGYDLVFLSAIIHSNSSEQNAKLVEKCACALNPQGRLVVQDYIMDEERTSPVAGAMFALNMLVGTIAGDTYTEREVRDWMTRAGLSQVTLAHTPFGVAQMTGRKPA